MLGNKFSVVEMYERFHLKHVPDDEIGVLWDGEPVILQDLRGDPATVDVSADAVSFLDAEINIKLN